MRKANLILKCLFLLMLSTGLNAQNFYNIRLNKIQSEQIDKICYDVQLASAQAADFNLAGQNYRLFYDSEKLRYVENSAKSLLPAPTYTTIILRDNSYNQDASGVGYLPFESDLGFLNIEIDLNDLTNGGAVLPASGEWQNTAQVCFDLITVNNEEQEASIYWGREVLTKEYATAYVEVAEWIAPQEIQLAMANNYEDIALSTNLTEIQELTKPKVYPIPTKDKVWIDYNFQGKIELQLYNATGELVLEQTLAANDEAAISLRNYAAGYYQLVIRTDNQVFTEGVEKIK